MDDIQLHFLQWILVRFAPNFTNVCSWVFNWQYVSIGWGDGLATNHCLNQCWHRVLMSYHVTGLQGVISNRLTTPNAHAVVFHSSLGVRIRVGGGEYRIAHLQHDLNQICLKSDYTLQMPFPMYFIARRQLCILISLQWRHNGRDDFSNHQPHDCLLNRLFWSISRKTSKLRVTGLCVGNSPVTGEFPSQRASNAENVSIWWRHHVNFAFTYW